MCLNTITWQNVYILYKSNPSTFQLISTDSALFPLLSSECQQSFLSGWDTKSLTVVHSGIGALCPSDLWPFGAATHQLTWSSIHAGSRPHLTVSPSTPSTSLPVHTSLSLLSLFPFLCNLISCRWKQKLFHKENITLHTSLNHKNDFLKHIL